MASKRDEEIRRKAIANLSNAYKKLGDGRSQSDYEDIASEKVDAIIKQGKGTGAAYKAALSTAEKASKGAESGDSSIFDDFGNAAASELEQVTGEFNGAGGSTYLSGDEADLGKVQSREELLQESANNVLKGKLAAQKNEGAIEPEVAIAPEDTSAPQISPEPDAAAVVADPAVADPAVADPAERDPSVSFTKEEGSFFRDYIANKKSEGVSFTKEKPEQDLDGSMGRPLEGETADEYEGRLRERTAKRKARDAARRLAQKGKSQDAAPTPADATAPDMPATGETGGMSEGAETPKPPTVGGASGEVGANPEPAVGGNKLSRGNTSTAAQSTAQEVATTGGRSGRSGYVPRAPSDGINYTFDPNERLAGRIDLDKQFKKEGITSYKDVSPELRKASLGLGLNENDLNKYFRKQQRRV